MKKIYSLMFIAVLAAISLTSCDEKYNGIETKEGKLSFENFEASVYNAENVIESRAAKVDVSSFTVVVNDNKTGEAVASWVYSELPEVVSLPLGDYKVKVYNAELQNAAWEAPYFYGEQSFTIVKNDITKVEPVVCKLSNLKVTIKYSDELKYAIGDGADVKVNVKVGENSSLDFAYGEERAGYFRCDADNKSLVATFSGTVDGCYVSEFKVISDVAVGQHRIITFSLKTAPEITDESGLIGTTGLSLNASVSIEDLLRDVVVEEELVQPDDFMTLSESELSFSMKAGSKNVTVKSSSEWTAVSSADWCTVSPATGAAPEGKLTISVADNTVTSERTAVVTVTMGSITREIAVKQAAYSEQPSIAAPTVTSTTIDLSVANKITDASIVDVDINAPGKIANFNVKIRMSDGNGGQMDLASVGLANEFDLCNPGDLESGLAGLGLPVGSDVKGQTEMKFDISGFMPMLVAFAGNHYFELEVIDELGQSVNITLTLIVE